MAANTLFGFFRDGLKAQHCSTRHFSRAFLGVFISEYRASQQAGRACYVKTKETDFYRLNGPAYCVFLELWAEYDAAMKKWRARA